MSEYIKYYFIRELKARTSDVAKEDILNLALECGLDIKPRVARVKIIDMLVEEGHYDRLFEYFNEFITVPVWDAADYYNMSTNRVTQLKSIGAIKEEPIKKEFYSRQDKSYFNADTYPLSIFMYKEEELKSTYDKAFGGNTHQLRIETKTNEEVKELITILEKVFKIEKAPTTYQHRNNDGQYTYFSVKILNNSEEEQNALLAQISKLKAAQEKLKKEHKEDMSKILRTLKEYLGEDVALYNLDIKLEELVNNNEVNKLNSIPSQNPRNAGRKPKFNKNKIIEMEIMKENGYSYKAIAEEYNTTKATVIKYLKHKKKNS